MAVKLDVNNISSEFETLKNYQRVTAVVSVSGTIATGTNDFTTNVALPLAGTVAEVYFQAPGTSYKKRTDVLLRVPEYVGADYATVTVGYSSNQLALTISVQNGGAPYAATPQDFTFTVVLYNAPIT